MDSGSGGSGSFGGSDIDVGDYSDYSSGATHSSKKKSRLPKEEKLLSQKRIASEELDLDELLELANGNFKADFEVPIFLSHTTKKGQVYSTHKLFIAMELWDALQEEWYSLSILTFDKPRAYLTR